MGEAVEEYDFVIVGGGSAGCTLANRLTADPDCRVLLLEAGGWDTDPWIHIPLGWGRILLNRMHDWMYFAEPEVSTDGRAVECARGKVIGGSSSINAMAYVRGHQQDYARWASRGLPEWSWDQVLPYFRRQENWCGPATDLRGTGGPLNTQYCRYADPLISAYHRAGIEAGHRDNEDYNGVEQEGFANWQMTIRNGRRCSAAVAYLHPVLGRKNLRVRTRADACRVIFDHKNAEAVEYLHRGRRRVAYARGEVILCGGVINSPHLLMLSGVGDADALRAHGIEPLVDLPAVGKNLQDHMSAALFYRRCDRGPLHRAMRLDRIALELANTYFRGEGIANDLPGGVMAFVRSREQEPIPDMQLLFNAAPLDAHPYFVPFVKPYQDGFAARVVGLRPRSRGAVTLASENPLVAPAIRQNFFDDEDDIRVLRDGLRMAREVARQPALRPFLERELAPGPDIDSDAAIDAYIRATAITVHHPLGTCRMGAPDDPDAVVDARLRVYGVERLRVVDASVMPDLVGGNINAPVIMIAERAAEFLTRAPASYDDEDLLI